MAPGILKIRTHGNDILNYMLIEILIFIASLFLVVRGATLATTHATRLAESWRLSKYTVGFIVIAIISILPETFISVQSAIQGVPEFGLGLLLGSNIADLTLIFALVVLISGRKMKVETKILRSHVLYPFILLIPIVLGFDGHFTRIEGAALIVTGIIFYYRSLHSEFGEEMPHARSEKRLYSFLYLLLSLGLLSLGSHFVLTSASALAAYIGISSVLIGMLVVALGTTLPELLFSLKAVKQNDDSLAVGDILGTVLANATIVIGLLAIINPFSFPQQMIYVSGIFMVSAAFLLFIFMSSGRAITRYEAYALFLFWATFASIQFIIAI